MKKMFLAVASFTMLFTSCIKKECRPTLSVHPENAASIVYVYVNGHKHKLEKGKYLEFRKDDRVKVGYYGKEYYNFPDCNEYRILQHAGKTYIVPANLENWLD